MEQEELLKKYDEEVEQLLKELDEWDIVQLNISRGGKPTNLEYAKMLFVKLQGKVPVKQILKTEVDTLGECLGIFDVEVSMDEEELSEEKAKAILSDINAKKNEISRGAIGTLFEEHAVEDILEQRKKGLTYEQIVEKYYPFAKLYNKELTEQDWNLFIETALLPKTKAEDGSLVPDYSFKETSQYKQLLGVISNLNPSDIMLKTSWWFDEFDPNRCVFKASKDGTDYTFGVHNPNITISRKSQSVMQSESDTLTYQVIYDEETKAYVLKEYDYIECGGRKLSTETFDGKTSKIGIEYGGMNLKIEKMEEGLKVDYSYTQPRTRVYEMLSEMLENGNSQQKEQLKKAIGDLSEKEIIDTLNEERISGAVAAIGNYEYNKPSEDTLVSDINTGLQAMQDLYFSSEEGVKKLKERYQEFGFSLPFYVPDFVKSNPNLNTELMHNLEEKCKVIVKEDPDYDPEIQNEDGSSKLEFSYDFEDIQNDLGGYERNDRRIVAKMIYLNNWDMIEQLWALKIKKEELYNLYKTCCNKDLSKMKITMDMLQSGVLSQDDFHANLQSEEPVPFISDYTGIQSEMPDEEKLKFYQECSVDYSTRRDAIAKLKKTMSENDRLTAEEKEAAQLEKQFEDYTQGKDGKTIEGE